MLHLRALGLLDESVLTVTGEPLARTLDWWQASERRKRLRERLYQEDGVDPDDVIMSPRQAKEQGLTSTVTFPRGNLAPEGSVIKSTAIDPSVVDADGVYRKTGPARVFTREKEAIAAIKGQGDHPLKPGDVLVLMGRGPMGAGMEEIYQITASLRHLSFGKQIAVLTDARFSGVSTGACIGHISPEALAGGPLGKVRDGDLIRIVVDRVNLEGSLDLVGAEGASSAPKRGCAFSPAADLIPSSRPTPSCPTTPVSGRPFRPSAEAPGAAASSTPRRSSRHWAADRETTKGRFGFSPRERLGEELGDQVLVVRLELLDVGRLVPLGVEVVRVELPDPLHQVAVAVVHQVGVLALAVRRVEGVIADHRQALVGEVVLDDVVEILVVAPGHVDVVQPAARLVDPALGLVFGHVPVGVVLEELVEDDLLGVAAADREGVAHDGPLGLAQEAEDLAQVVDQAGEDEPAGMAVGPDGLGGLHQVFNLGELVSGSLSSTSVFRYSIASQIPIRLRVWPRNSRFFARTKSRV